MKSVYIILFILSFQTLYSAEENPFNFRDEVYDEYVKTVTLDVNNLPTNFPIISLNSGQYFMLKFDDLLNEERNYYYRIIHCDKDWTQSSLREIETINGFNDERLRNYSYSINTKVPYIHYWQQFPNKDTKFNVSGNYLLVIYEDRIDYPVLTRRFIIKEDRVGISMDNTYPGDVENIRYKQELLININFDKFKMRNPVDEVSIVILRNEEWNSAVTAKPSFFSNSILKFNRVQTFSWWGLAEFRDFDTRSLMRLGRGVRHIERNMNNIDIVLNTDFSRRNKVHLVEFDFNGRFLVDNFEALRGNTINDVLDNFVSSTLSNQNLTQTYRDSLLSGINSRNSLLDDNNVAEERNIRSDYTNVTFMLDDDINLGDANIYVLGAMNNWLPSEEYKMKYNSKRSMYTTTVQLKQGYYNYMYAVVNNKNEINYHVMEGSWNETENEYQAIAYYRGLGDIYDRVIGFNSYNTNTSFTRLR